MPNIASFNSRPCEGAIPPAASLLQRQHPGLRLADSARLALLTWQSSRNDLQASLAGADHAVFLDRVGYRADIAFACIPDAVEAVPELHEVPHGDGMRAVLRRVPPDAMGPRLETALPLPEPAPVGPPRMERAQTAQNRFASSVDPENEHDLIAALSRLTAGKTVISIAHRLNTVATADQILVLDAGRIVQRGRHGQLMEEEGLYRSFIELRRAAAGWTIGG